MGALSSQSSQVDVQYRSSILGLPPSFSFCICICIAFGFIAFRAAAQRCQPGLPFAISAHPLLTLTFKLTLQARRIGYYTFIALPCPRRQASAISPFIIKGQRFGNRHSCPAYLLPLTFYFFRPRYGSGRLAWLCQVGFAAWLRLLHFAGAFVRFQRAPAFAIIITGH